jgi:hypothetical protein
VHELPQQSLDSTLSLIVIVAINAGLVWLLLVWLLRWIKQARLARQADVAFRPDAPLVEGRAVVGGKVEIDEDAELAVRVEIRQKGREIKGKRTNHIFEEVSRKVTHRAFTIVCASGERVRVLPDDRIFFVDTLDDTEWHARDSRTRIGELSPGENAVIEGVLSRETRFDARGGGGYRDGGIVGGDWSLRPPTDGRMIICAEAPSARFRRKRSAYRIAAILAGACLLIAQLFAFRTYMLELYGRRQVAVITDAHPYQGRTHGRHPHNYSGCSVTVRCEDGTCFARESFAIRLCDDLSAGERVVVLTGGGETAVDGNNGLDWGRGLMLFAMMGIALFSLWIARSRDWFDGPFNESGSGPLSTHSPAKTRKRRKRKR